jgi:hypothetical protein
VINIRAKRTKCRNNKELRIILEETMVGMYSGNGN